MNKADPLNLMAAPTNGQPSGDSEGHGQTVAKHYNQLQEAGRDSRYDSRIFFMRNFNNWIKSVVIGETLKQLKRERLQGQRITVLDLCSGKGGDLLKWKKAGIHHLVCADIAETSVEQSESRYRDMVDRERNRNNVFTSEFYTADCSKQPLTKLYKNPDIQFDVCSCQFSFHYCFESLPQVEVMLENAVGNLSLGGYFIGTTPNSQEIVRRLRDSKDQSFGNDVYRVTFDNENKDDLPLFGAQYNFHLEGVVDCPEFLVFFPVLQKMAEKHGMKLVYKKPFADFFNEYVQDFEHKSLLGRMKALESFPPDRGGKLMGAEEEYEHAKSCVDRLTHEESQEDGDRRRRPVSVGTLSKSEWEAVTIYCVFMFQKVRDPKTNEEWKPAVTSESPSSKRTYNEMQAPT